LVESVDGVSTGNLEAALQRLLEQAPPHLFDLIEETVIRTAFTHCESNQVQTSLLLDISRNVLRHKLAKYGMLPARQPTAPAKPSQASQHTSPRLLEGLLTL
jgi:sigma-54-specific transcriptional regulator